MSSKRVLALLAIAACAAVHAAPANAEGEVETGAFRLKGSNGFSIFAIAVSKPHLVQALESKKSRGGGEMRRLSTLSPYGGQTRHDRSAGR